MLEPWRNGKVIKIKDATYNTRRFWIEVQDTARFDFKPGQFVTLDLPISEKRNKRWRSYSIASHPNGSNIIELIIVLMEGGAGTNYLFSQVQVGSTLLLRGPQGVFVLPPVLDKDLLLICTGTGVAPFRSMVKHIYEQQVAHKNIYLLYGCRLLTDSLYKDELKNLAANMPGFTYLPAYSREHQMQPGIHHGYVHHLYEQILLSGNKPPAYFFLCGWKNMVDEAKQKIIALGYDSHDIHLELYG